MKHRIKILFLFLLAGFLSAVPVYAETYRLEAKDADLSEAPDVIVEPDEPPFNLGGWHGENAVIFRVNVKEAGAYRVILVYSKDESVGDPAKLGIKVTNEESGESGSGIFNIPATGNDWSNYEERELGTFNHLEAGETVLRLESREPQEGKYVMNLRALILSSREDGIDEESDSGGTPDANVKGLWLTCPSFPKDAKVVEFENNEEYGVAMYVREIDDGALRFTIAKQPIEDSELQKPDDVTNYINVTNADGSEVEIEVDTEAETFTKLYSYPCATEEYKVDEGEGTRAYAMLFIFTDKYCFYVEVSTTEDSVADYQPRLAKWLTGLEFVGEE